MIFAVFKLFTSAALILAISELAKRFPSMAALLASLPLITVLSFCWIYLESKDTAKITVMSYEIFWLVLPSLLFLLLLPFLLKKEINFWLALALAVIVLGAAYAFCLRALRP